MKNETKQNRKDWLIALLIKDFRALLSRHDKSEITKIKVAGDDIAAITAEIRKKMADVKNPSECIIAITARNSDGLKLEEVTAISDAVMHKSPNMYVWGVDYNSDADQNFSVAVYVA